MMIANRESFAAARRRLPYNAEVEYLESTGTQWINTGVVPDNTYTFDSSVAVLEEPYNCVYWGCRRDGAFGSYDLQCYLSSNTTASEYLYKNIRLFSTNGSLHTNWNSWIMPVVGRMYSLTGMTVVSAMKPMIYPVTLFAFNIKGSVNSSLGKCRIGGWTAYSNGVAVADFIPVHFTNELGVSEGAMYDRLGVGGMNPDGSPRTDGLYRNRGTGAFIFGLDK